MDTRQLWKGNIRKGKNLHEREGHGADLYAKCPLSQVPT